MLRKNRAEPLVFFPCKNIIREMKKVLAFWQYIAKIFRVIQAGSFGCKTFNP
jgi:hypothetical protein